MVSFGVLAGIMVVAGFMAIQFPPRPAPPAAVDYGPPPPSVPLIWVQDPNHLGWLIGFDWTGKPRGTAKVSQPLGPYAKLSQAPDGSTFGIGPNGKGGFKVYLDRLGNPSPRPASTINYQFEMWADDSRHVCTLDGLGGHWSLGLIVPGGAQNPVNVVAIDPTLGQSGIIAYSFAACSARNDRAVIVYAYAGRPTEYWVARISDGAILQQRTYPANQLANVTASMDASVIAENSGKSVGQLAPPAASTVIRRASDLSVITTLDSSIGVLGFSSDDSLALASLTPWTSGVATNLAVFDAQTGKMLWRSRWNEELSAFLAEPDGRDLAVIGQAPGDSTVHPSVNIVIVHSGGDETDVPGRYTAV